MSAHMLTDTDACSPSLRLGVSMWPMIRVYVFPQWADLNLNRIDGIVKPAGICITHVAVSVVPALCALHIT